ncbi:hypothetical protein K8I31_21295 [bacterium]|nr:hypothetical protein [bacterium]
MDRDFEVKQAPFLGNVIELSRKLSFFAPLFKGGGAESAGGIPKQQKRNEKFKQYFKGCSPRRTSRRLALATLPFF